MFKLKNATQRWAAASVAVVCVALAAAQSQAQVTVVIGQNFTGTTYDPNSPVIPPDANGAIGPRHFVEFINGSFTVYNKTNGQSVKRITDMNFWYDAGLTFPSSSVTTDPRVIYDPTTQRWFASQVDADNSATDPTLNANHFLLAVSATADPTGAWQGFKFYADPDTGNFADFPTLGVDANAVYISGDLYHGQANPVGAGLVSIPKGDLLAGTPTIANRSWFGVMNYTNRGQVLQPAICFDGSSSSNVLATGDIGMTSDPHSNLVSFAVQNAAGPGALLAGATSIPVSPYVVPFNADMDAPWFTPTQLDGTTNLSGNDARFSAKVYAVGGSLYAVHSTELNNRMAIRWYRVSATNHTLLESGTIADADLDLFFPSIAANPSGVVVIGCNGCSLNVNVSCYAYVGQTVNGVTTFGSSILLQSGATSYHGDDEQVAMLLDTPPYSSRWGDYSATSVDPADPNRFWTIQMYPSDAANNDIWSTQIIELITSIPSPRLAITMSNAFAVVSWPATAGAFNLETSSNLGVTNGWTVVTQNLATNSGQIFFQTASTNRTKYFRLHKP